MKLDVDVCGLGVCCVGVCRKTAQQEEFKTLRRAADVFMPFK